MLNWMMSRQRERIDEKVVEAYLKVGTQLVYNCGKP